MSRHTKALLVAASVLLALYVTLGVVPAPYVVMSPGPTVNLLGAHEGNDYIQIHGAPVYRDRGALRMLTVVSTGPEEHVSAWDALTAWGSPRDAVYRYEDIYAPQETSETVKEDAGVDMTNSQDTAIAVALHRLGKTFPTYVQILGVAPDGPSEGILQVHDLVLRVQGQRITSPEEAVTAIQGAKPGDRVRLVIKRKGHIRNVSVTAIESTREKGKAALQVSIGIGYEFPIDVRVALDDNIGGPSAGMMFATAIYDTLTPGSLTGGQSVAGTGTIDTDGRVGPIGGIGQKLAAAEAAGAKLFLAPAGNCDEVRAATWDHSAMRVVRVDTFDQAISDIEAWSKDPKATMVECTS